MSDEHDGGCLQLKDIVLDLATGFPISTRTINIRTGTESITGQRMRSDRGPKIWPRERIDPCRRSCIRSGECQTGSRYIRFGNVTDCIGQGEVQKEKRASWRKEEVVSVEVSVHVLRFASWKNFSSADDPTCLVNGSSREQARRKSISA